MLDLTGQRFKACLKNLLKRRRELQEHLNGLPANPNPQQKPEVPLELLEKVEGEVGDLFFVLVNIARYLSVDPESALRKTNRKFRRRFGWLEERLREQGRTLEQATLEEMESSMAAGQDPGGTKALSVAERGTEQITIRKCAGIDELNACVALQKEVWNFSDLDLIPLRMFVVSQKIGGQTIGAFHGDDLVGFTFSIPGSRAGHAYLHSHMLAVRDSFRNHGLGRKLKLAQREDAIQQGFELLEWTFDPLEIKNAHLNLSRLGAIARRYSVNHYGHSSSPLQGGLPTDRLVAEWWLKSKRVVNLLDKKQPPQFKVEKKIEVPAQIYAWKASADDRPKAAEIQKRNRQDFLSAFSQGLVALGYERDAQENGAFLLGRWDEEWSYASQEED